MGTPAEKLSLGMCKRIRTDDIRSLPLMGCHYKRESPAGWMTKIFTSSSITPVIPANGSMP